MSTPPASAPESLFDAGTLTLIRIIRDYYTEESARALIESIRWSNGRTCPHCGVVNDSALLEGKSHRPGLYWCRSCEKQFTVMVGTIFEDSHIPLNKWLLAFYMMAASKTQISALQLQRQLELGSYRTAWFMCHRIRFALSETPDPNDKLSGTVEVDETWVGGLAKNAHGSRIPRKTAVVAFLERGGRVRTQIVPAVNKEEVGVLLKKHVEKSAVLNTDESNVYPESASYFAGHDTVNHSKDEYVRQDRFTGRVATTNAVEGFFGNTKRSIDGTHHAVSPDYLALYLAELDHKFNTRAASDGARTVDGVARIEGKRLSLRPMKTACKPGVETSKLVARKIRTDAKGAA
jgi:transposase-like protein